MNHSDHRYVSQVRNGGDRHETSVDEPQPPRRPLPLPIRPQTLQPLHHQRIKRQRLRTIKQHVEALCTFDSFAPACFHHWRSNAKIADSSGVSSGIS